MRVGRIVPLETFDDLEAVCLRCYIMYRLALFVLGRYNVIVKLNPVMSKTLPPERNERSGPKPFELPVSVYLA